MGSSVFRVGASRPPPLFADDSLNDNAIVGMWYWDVLNDRLYAAYVAPGGDRAP